MYKLEDKIKKIMHKSTSCMTTIIISICAIGCVFFYGPAKLMNEQTNKCKVISIDKAEDRSGNSDGFHTTVYYIVTTDKGSYRVETSGINAHPECLAMKNDSTYIITTRGMSFPIFGVYPSIIGYKPINNNNVSQQPAN